jgi:hypothetical protein
LPRLAGEGGRVEVRAIRVMRHKPAKRCVIEYDVRVERPGREREKATLIGKIRARRYGSEGFRLQDAFWNAGFRKRCADQIAVPEPVGVVPEFRMWLQRRVRGVTVGALMAGPDGVALARRVAAAIRKVHHAGVPATRHHAMADELRILHECLPRVSALRPEFAARIARLLAACDRLAAGVPVPHPCGIHRDFYPAQVIVDGARLWLLDFDLYVRAIPGWTRGISSRTSRRKSAPARRCGGVAWSGVRPRGALCRTGRADGASGGASLHHVDAGAARVLEHAVPQRSAFTGALLNLCEQRLA